MNEKEIVRDIMKTLDINQTELAERTGYKAASGISEILNRKGMRVDILLKLVNAMGCEVVIRSKDCEWVIGGTKTEKPYNLNSLLKD